MTAAAPVCPECKYEPPKRDYPDFITPIDVMPPGTMTHRADCPTLPHLSPEDKQKLDDDLRELARARARAEVEARNYVIY